MGNRQYIGARYVPRFTGEYDATTVYEGLDVVDNGVGTSYIARKPVPAGTPLTNSEYWAVYGASSGAIVDLQDQINDINLEINDLPTIRTDIGNLQTHDKKHRNIAIYLGNSFINGVGSTSGEDGIFKKTKDMFNAAYKYADGGVGFLTYTGHTKTFYTLLQNAIADTSFDNSDVSDIIICSAIGDTCALKERGSAFSTDLSTAMQNLMSLINSEFPANVRVTLAMVEGRVRTSFTSSYVGDVPYKTPFNVNRYLSLYSERYGYDYIGWIGWNIFMRGTGYHSADETHPNDLGYDVLSTTFKNAFNGAYNPVIRETVVHGSSEFISGATVEARMGILPDYSIITLSKVNCPSGTSPAQYAVIALAALFDSDDTKLVPPKTHSADDDLGNFILDCTSSGNFKFNCYLKDDGDSKCKITGTQYDAQASVSGSTNYSLPYSFTIYHTL